MDTSNIVEWNFEAANLDIELFKKDFEGYFNHLLVDPIIVAENAETHPATTCFTEGYLRPLGIKSMLDVPIIFMLFYNRTLFNFEFKTYYFN